MSAPEQFDHNMASSSLEHDPVEPDVMPSKNTQPNRLDPEIEQGLIDQVQQTGDRHALGLLIDSYYTSLLDYAHFRTIEARISGHDVAQEAIVKVLNVIRDREDRGEPLPRPEIGYFMSAVKSVISDQYKSHYQKRTSLVGSFSDDGAGSHTPDFSDALVDQVVTKQALNAALNVILSNLTPMQYDVATAVWMGESIADVAERHGITTGAVKAYTFRAREWARRLLKQSKISLPEGIITGTARREQHTPPADIQQEYTERSYIHIYTKFQQDAQNGDSEAFGSLADLYRDELLRHAARLYDRAAAYSPTEDAVQAAFCKILDALAKPIKAERPYPALPYFYAALRSVIYDDIRASYRRPVVLAGSLDGFKDTFADGKAQNSYEQIESAMVAYSALKTFFTQITDDQRWLAREYFIKQRSVADIAQEQGVKVEAIKRRLERIRARARQLKQYGVIDRP